MSKGIIYLMGAGRSGTTALTTFLGNNSSIQAIGEMHQFFEHIEHNKPCSCGALLGKCEFWSEILNYLPHDYLKNPKEYRAICDTFEYHKAIPKYLFHAFKSEDLEKYCDINEVVLNAVEKTHTQSYIIDSAKYIGRALGLSKSKKINLKIIYVIRDVRGVIYSFSKKVQSSRTPLSTIMYWLVINGVAEIVYRFTPKDKIIKLKYEDLVEMPNRELERLEEFLDTDLSDIKGRIMHDEPFDMPHIIGGNRIKSNKQIHFKRDVSWKDDTSAFYRVAYYLLASPIMLLNKFKI
ncbi:MAG: sulfotransferase domain-containing protein [Candidatus Thiodiazotropha sp.]